MTSPVDNRIEKDGLLICDKGNLTNVGEKARMRGAALRHLLQLQQGIRHLSTLVFIEYV